MMQNAYSNETLRPLILKRWSVENFAPFDWILSFSITSCGKSQYLLLVFHFRVIGKGEKKIHLKFKSLTFSLGWIFTAALDTYSISTTQRTELCLYYV